MTLSKILFFSVVLAIFVFFVFSASGNVFKMQRPVKAREWTRTAKVWTARSCVGEAGFEAIDECIAIAWVYATRAAEAKKGYLWIVRRYSAALKRHSLHTRPWILQLNHTMEKPKDWPNLNWRVHRHLWKKLLSALEDWARGYVPNPIPEANHYGSSRDAKRARYVRRWKKLDAPVGFRNWFFNSRVIKKKNEIDWSEAGYWKNNYLPTMKGVELLRKGETRYGNLIIDNRKNVR